MAPVSNCPECGADMALKDCETHAFTHWGVTADKIGRLQNEDAKKRYKELMGG